MTQSFQRLALGLVALLVGAVVAFSALRGPVQVSYGPSPPATVAQLTVPKTQTPRLGAGQPDAGQIDADPGAKTVDQQDHDQALDGVTDPGNASMGQREPAPAKPTVADVVEYFNKKNYTLAAIRSHGMAPRILLTSLPADLADMRDIDQRKRIFFRTLLPLVLEVNEEILKERRKLWRLMKRKESGDRLGAVDQLWLNRLAKRYRADPKDLDTLFRRVDIIPPSLALAQAAKESGWGTSRFSQQGNALFGQWTWNDEAPGITPKDRSAGKSHRIRAFKNLLGSVRAYALNLNRHRAYSLLRDVRLQQREAGQTISGHALAAGLLKYSEIGQRYVDALRSIIDANGLASLDDLRLENGPADSPAI